MSAMSPLMNNARHADLLFDNGLIFTADGSSGLPRREPVAVADGRILAIGPAAR
jgi:predicted amidohydrolase YtcJ